MIDHVVIPVADIAASRRFYEAALAPLGMSVILAFPHSVGFGADRKPDFWIGRRDPIGMVHVALAAPDRATVDAFHTAALAAGARDNGGPGVREVYHPSYYGAFVLDPDGHNLEAVCHRPEGRSGA